uniref:Uncharacterized protein n=1 Tax=Arundo donax TaxID=35708 RepID=A0A0A9MB86_ARUDO
MAYNFTYSLHSSIWINSVLLIFSGTIFLFTACE